MGKAEENWTTVKNYFFWQIMKVILNHMPTESLRCQMLQIKKCLMNNYLTILGYLLN